jgi:hypothetical protein
VYLGFVSPAQEDSWRALEVATGKSVPSQIALRVAHSDRTVHHGTKPEILAVDPAFLRALQRRDDPHHRDGHCREARRVEVSSVDLAETDAGEKSGHRSAKAYWEKESDGVIQPVRLLMALKRMATTDRRRSPPLWPTDVQPGVD